MSSNLGHLKALRSFDECKKTFKKHFKGREELDPLRTLISIFTLTKDPQ